MDADGHGFIFSRATSAENNGSTEEQVDAVLEFAAHSLEPAVAG
jgi:hypothetical protein